MPVPMPGPPIAASSSGSRSPPYQSPPQAARPGLSRDKASPCRGSGETERRRPPGPRPGPSPTSKGSYRLSAARAGEAGTRRCRKRPPLTHSLTHSVRPSLPSSASHHGALPLAGPRQLPPPRRALATGSWPPDVTAPSQHAPSRQRPRPAANAQALRMRPLAAHVRCGLARRRAQYWGFRGPAWLLPFSPFLFPAFSFCCCGGRGGECLGCGFFP